MVLQDEINAIVNSRYLQLYRLIDQSPGEEWNSMIYEQCREILRQGLEEEENEEIEMIPIDHSLLQSIHPSYDYQQVNRNDDIHDDNG